MEYTKVKVVIEDLPTTNGNMEERPKYRTRDGKTTFLNIDVYLWGKFSNKPCNKNVGKNIIYQNSPPNYQGSYKSP